MEPNQIEMILTRLFAPINYKLNLLPAKENIEHLLQAFSEETANGKSRVYSKGS